MRNIVHKTMKPRSGYTLIEVVISLFIFIAIAIPMLAGVFTNTGTLRSEEALVASWILEQEATEARLFPEKVVPVRRRVAGGKEWIIHLQRSGSPLVRVDLTAEYKGKKCGRVVVYAYQKEATVP